MSINVVFVDRDWKKSRHYSEKSTRKNMKILHPTIAGIVREIKPAMLCMCEVGEASNPLTHANMQQIADTIEKAWQSVATEHVRLKFLFTADAPYMTAYNELQVQCTEHRIFRNLYSAQGQPRTAQVFLCRGPDDVAVDIINVHAPSGNSTLTDAQRKTLLRNLLQSNSKSMPGHTVGMARFLIGGDINMSSHLLSQMLQVLHQDGVLQTKEQVMEPKKPKQGDLCFLGGFVAQSLETTAKNHDPQHVPYGIQWISSLASGYATEQFPISSFGSPRHRAELHTTAEELQQTSCTENDIIDRGTYQACFGFCYRANPARREEATTSSRGAATSSAGGRCG